MTTHCYAGTHVRGCRPGRPLCKAQRRVRASRRPCHCGAYHFPHRAQSGRCGDPERMEEFVHGPERHPTDEREYKDPPPSSEDLAQWLADIAAGTETADTTYLRG